MPRKKPATFGALKRKVSRLPDIRQEMRNNLVSRLKNKQPLFSGMIGYDETVLPAMVNAVLCGHNIIFLGERGQGKSRMIRQMTDFLDDEIPVIKDCPINDDPFAPICISCRQLKAEAKDDMPIDYISKDRRLVEKLATSDVSTADLIGEVDPIKVARGRTLDDESVIHFGLVPRSNRGIFAINELPDLAEKIQVAFFNIMEESDFQIKGFPVRLPLDIFIVATANPEDYTNRGRIITPLKDRFDAQIRTHYPKMKKHEIRIMEQEGRRLSVDGIETRIPGYIKEILAELTFHARASSEISQHSGVSCRVSISSYEAIAGAAVGRCLEVGESLAVPRITDIEMVFPAVAGKLEFEYQAPDTDSGDIVLRLAKKAVKTVFDSCFKSHDLDEIVSAFEKGMTADISRLQPSEAYMEGLKYIPGMQGAVERLCDSQNAPEVASAVEFILEGLHLSDRINCEVHENGVIYK